MREISIEYRVPNGHTLARVKVQEAPGGMIELVVWNGEGHAVQLGFTRAAFVATVQAITAIGKVLDYE